MEFSTRRRKWAVKSVLLMSAVLLLWIVPALAQQTQPQPIQTGENLFGELTLERSTAAYAFTATEGELVNVQVLSIELTTFLTLRVINSAGIEVLNAANAEQALIVEASVLLDEAGVYWIEVGSTGGTGQFVLSLQAGAALPEPVDLVLGEAVQASVDAETPMRVYQFESRAEADVLLRVRREGGDGSPIVTLRDEHDAESVRTLATSALDAAGMTTITYRLAAGAARYGVEVAHSGSAGEAAYSICLWTESAQGGCAEGEGVTDTVTAVSPTAQSQVSATPANGCMVLAATGGSVNVRQGPGTNYLIVGSLSGTQTLLVTGRLSNSSWYQVNLNGQAAWVGSTVVTLVGDCGNVPVLTPPVLPTSMPTTAPSATVMATLTATLTSPAPLTPTPITPAPGGATGNTGGVLDNIQDFEEILPDLSINRAEFIEIGEDANGFHLYAFYYNIASTFVTGIPYTITLCVDATCFNMPVSGGGGTNYFFDLGSQFNASTANYSFVIDSANNIEESNEFNNVVTGQFHFRLDS